MSVVDGSFLGLSCEGSCVVPSSEAAERVKVRMELRTVAGLS